MKPIQTFTIEPTLPDNLKRLKEIAYNLFWTWHPDTISLFHRIDPDLWEGTGHNPALMLGLVGQERLEKLALDDVSSRNLSAAGANSTSTSTARQTGTAAWAGRTPTTASRISSAEFGVSDCMPIYSGGLGVLAGDHIKSSSELGLPLVGVGLLYQKGYFRQYLNIDGWQQESYPVNDFYNMPVTMMHNEDGSPMRVGVEFPGRQVFAQSGGCRWGATRSTCSTPTSTRTRCSTAGSRPSCTAATSNCASSRR